MAETPDAFCVPDNLPNQMPILDAENVAALQVQITTQHMVGREHVQYAELLNRLGANTTPEKEKFWANRPKRGMKK